MSQRSRFTVAKKATNSIPNSSRKLHRISSRADFWSSNSATKASPRFSHCSTNLPGPTSESPTTSRESLVSCPQNAVLLRAKCQGLAQLQLRSYCIIATDARYSHCSDPRHLQLGVGGRHKLGQRKR